MGYGVLELVFVHILPERGFRLPKDSRGKLYNGKMELQFPLVAVESALCSYDLQFNTFRKIKLILSLFSVQVITNDKELVYCGVA